MVFITFFRYACKQICSPCVLYVDYAKIIVPKCGKRLALLSGKAISEKKHRNERSVVTGNREKVLSPSTRGLRSCSRSPSVLDIDRCNARMIFTEATAGLRNIMSSMSRFDKELFFTLQPLRFYAYISL